MLAQHVDVNVVISEELLELRELEQLYVKVLEAVSGLLLQQLRAGVLVEHELEESVVLLDHQTHTVTFSLLLVHFKVHYLQSTTWYL